MNREDTSSFEENIHHDPKQYTEPEKVSFLGKLISKLSLAQVLRWGGSIVLATAALVFMFQGVYSFDPMTRHWLMLAICALLGIMGLATGAILKEEKGARAFLGFAAGTFPVLASQLGAMLFSLFGHAPDGMPQPLVFALGDASKVAVVACVTFAIVVPVSYLTFKILARSQAALMTCVFILANLCILLPVRESFLVGIVLATSAAVIGWIDITMLHRDFRLENFEGRIARFLFASPMLVIMGRAVFYPMGAVFYGTMLIVVGCYVAFFWGRVFKRAGVKLLCQLTGQGGVIIGWLMCLFPVLESAFFSDGMMVYLAMLPVAIALGVQALFSEGKASACYRNSAATIAFLSVAFTHFVWAGPMVSVAGLVVAIGLVSIGTLTAEKPVFILGALAAVTSLGNFCLQAVRMHSGYAWVVLALIGISVMFIASLVDKKYSWPLFKSGPIWGRAKVQKASM